MTAATSFEWKYNANKLEGDTIAKWWELFQLGQYTKLSLPK